MKHQVYLLLAWFLLLRIKGNFCCAPKFALPQGTEEFCNPPPIPNFIKIYLNIAFPLGLRHEVGQVSLTPWAWQTPYRRVQVPKCSQWALSLKRKKRFSLFNPQWFIRVRYHHRSSRTLMQKMLKSSHGRGWWDLSALKTVWKQDYFTGFFLGCLHAG